MPAWKRKAKNLHRASRTQRVSKSNKITPLDKSKFHKLHYQWSEANGFWHHADAKMKDETFYKLRNAFSDEILAKLIFDYIQHKVSWIVKILPELTGHQLQIPEKNKDNVEDIIQLWLKWAKENKYLD